MSDKIQPGGVNRYGPVAGSSRSSSVSADKTGSASSSGAAGKRGDSVSLTGEASLLQEAHAAASGASGVNSALVSEVKQQLRDGTYKSDPQMIASKMLKTEWELAST
ncbi:anti-sigma-28 factor, FlgM family [Solimonas aquatica]|uniref:Negative regulator of flagellin synthesis n=1 Tax=Solimonas aquatica TaxID=489703 RepID=A0A1H9E0H0_9GAMM|nr:flagellar biosynthesis anti-sigma factor FlgM [Solimonas aquatica]SEQ19279.1 anti-sigma-28 factor, FlgM family [Solimonas aquatica]